MALIDHVEIRTSAGDGGDGVVRWLHLKGKEKGGPAGGDGGRGGDIIFEGVRDIMALSQYRYEKEFNAESGHPGENNNKYGRDGKSIVLKVPVGSVLRRQDTGEQEEVLEDGQQIVFLKGGQGGYGNAHFKSSTNQNPASSKKGKKGESDTIDITLKLIADAGLVGSPNAGKSSLLNELTHAQSRVGAYPFTTLDPHLGSFYGYVLADIPGLIEGSAAGKGLGHKFLQHLERTRLIIHLVSAERDEISLTYKAIRNEMSGYSAELSEKKELIILTKTDVLKDEAEIALKRKELEMVSGREVLTMSILDAESVKRVAKAVSLHLSAL